MLLSCNHYVHIFFKFIDLSFNFIQFPKIKWILKLENAAISFLTFHKIFCYLTTRMLMANTKSRSYRMNIFNNFTALKKIAFTYSTSWADISLNTKKKLQKIKSLVNQNLLQNHQNQNLYPETLKHRVGVQRVQSYLMGRKCLFSLGWPPF